MGIVGSLIVTLFAMGATADSQLPHAEVAIQVLEASNDPGPTDGPSSRAARDLSATLNYKSYKTLAQEARSLGLDEWATVTLANGATLGVSPEDIDRNQHTIRLKVTVHQGKHHLDTDYTVRDGGTVFVSAGANGKNMLVLAIVPTVK